MHAALVEFLAEISGPQAPCGAVEQLRAQLILQPCDGLGYRRGRLTDPVRRGGEATVLDHPGEDTQSHELVQFGALRPRCLSASSLVPADKVDEEACQGGVLCRPGRKVHVHIDVLSHDLTVFAVRQEAMRSLPGGTGMDA